MSRSVSVGPNHIDFLQKKKSISELIVARVPRLGFLRQFVLETQFSVLREGC